MQRLNQVFFDRDPLELCRALLGKVMCRYLAPHWLFARIVETEAYYKNEKGSHSSLGETPKRRAMFMPPGTLYMYYAHGRDSLNISARGYGNAVLVKAAVPCIPPLGEAGLAHMHQRNPLPDGRARETRRLLAGQTLLCRALGLKVTDWDQHTFAEQFYLADDGYQPGHIIQCPRLGIPRGRDEHLPYRFVDAAHRRSATRNPPARHGQNNTGIIQ